MNNKKTTLTKNKEGYGYKYTELAEINKYCEANGITYYQEVETNEINGKDYIMTYITENGETKKIKGCQIIESKINNNPVQSYGSSLTYCRRYSLLLALGLATEDNDAADLCEELTKEQAMNIKLNFGKNAGKTLGEIYKENPKYLEWILSNSKDTNMTKACGLIIGVEVLTDEDKQREQLELLNKINILSVEKSVDINSITKHFNKNSTRELTLEELNKTVEMLEAK